jgi:hypothetical protein
MNIVTSSSSSSKHKQRQRVRIPKWLIRCCFLLVLALVLGAHLLTVKHLNGKIKRVNWSDDGPTSSSDKFKVHRAKATANFGDGSKTLRNAVLSRSIVAETPKRIEQQKQHAIPIPIPIPNTQQQQLSAAPAALPNDPHRPCQVLIINQHVEFHYEVLESVLALYPLLPSKVCDFENLDFTISVSSGANPHYRRKSDSWNEYAQSSIMGRNYTSSTTHQIRRLTRVIQTPVALNHTDTLFDYQISATCYCGEDMNWLFARTSRYCVFHVACRREFLQKNAPHRVQWLHPFFGPEDSFFPNYLPQFEKVAIAPNQNHRLCVIGHVTRRNYGLVRIFLDHRRTATAATGASPKIELHHFGWGEVPDCMKNFASLMTFHSKPDFIPWQHDLDDTCDAILSLLLRQNQTDYFAGGKTKLSGGLVQASAYRKPIVAHEDLAEMYKAHLVEVQTHTDDPATFVAAMDRLLERLTELKKKKR